MNFRTIRLGLAIAAGLLIAQATAAVAGGVANESGPAAYCVKKGGVVQTRLPAYDTNSGNPLILAGQRDFCQFTSKKDGSQINVLLKTLATRLPSLAALAYYAQVQMGTCNGNPASCYCSQLGGSDLFGGATGAGGGWVLNTDYNDVLEACIFPDMSSIDSWGLAYHSAGIIRGKDLAKVLRYGDPYAAHRAITPRKPLPFQR
jgi:putative hemolysin